MRWKKNHREQIFCTFIQFYTSLRTSLSQVSTCCKVTIYQDVLKYAKFLCGPRPGCRHPGQDTGEWSHRIAKELLPSQSSGMAERLGDWNWIAVLIHSPFHWTKESIDALLIWILDGLIWHYVRDCSTNCYVPQKDIFSLRTTHCLKI